MLPHQVMIVHDHLADFKGMNVDVEIYANLKFEKVYDHGLLHVSLVGSLIKEKERLSSF